jgi:hypothetical protein
MSLEQKAEIASGKNIDDPGEQVVAKDFVPLFKLTDAKEVYERLRDLQSQIKRQD